jgi:aminopeptidase N
MLRHDLGDELFQQCIQTFYETYKFDNALTEDFQKVAESLTGKSYEEFFRQWFYQPGHPVLSGNWKQKRKKMELTICQHQPQFIFDFPLEVEISGKNGMSVIYKLDIHLAEQTFIIDLPFKAGKIRLDPGTWLLFETYVPGNSSRPSS